MRQSFTALSGFLSQFCCCEMILSLFARLHFQQSVCRLFSTVQPPFAIGMMWSISRRRFGSLYVEFPQLQHVKLSRFLMKSRNFFVISIRCSLANAEAVSLLSNALISAANKINNPWQRCSPYSHFMALIESFQFASICEYISPFTLVQNIHTSRNNSVQSTVG